jgi:hypothetical protein
MAQTKTGKGEAEQREKASDRVDDAVAIRRHVDTGRNADDDADDQCGDRQVDRVRQGGGDDLDHGLLGQHRDPEVANHDAQHEVPVLNDEGAVEAELGAHGLDNLGCRLIAKHRRDGIARHHTDQYENQRQDNENRRDRGRQPRQDNFQHVAFCTFRSPHVMLVETSAGPALVRHGGGLVNPP